jgi:hypothetical protein
MNTIDLPGFTADASLYRTSGHYRTYVDASSRPAGHAGTILLSAIDVPGEVIEIEDDAPWSPPSWGGHTGPGSSGGSGETGPGGGGPGGGDGGIPETKGPPDFNTYHPHKGSPCSAENLGLTKGPKVDIRVGKYYPDAAAGSYQCCGKNHIDGNRACLGCQRKGSGGPCHNGWPCGPAGDC